LEKLGLAYDLAITSLKMRAPTAAVRKMIAGRILEAAATGERDVDKLCEIALRDVVD
jgi:hypothetical protein